MKYKYRVMQDAFGFFLQYKKSYWVFWKNHNSKDYRDISVEACLTKARRHFEQTKRADVVSFLEFDE